MSWNHTSGIRSSTLDMGKYSPSHTEYMTLKNVLISHVKWSQIALHQSFPVFLEFMWQ